MYDNWIRNYAGFIVGFAYGSCLFASIASPWYWLCFCWKLPLRCIDLLLFHFIFLMRLVFFFSSVKREKTWILPILLAFCLGANFELRIQFMIFCFGSNSRFFLKLAIFVFFTTQCLNNWICCEFDRKIGNTRKIWSIVCKIYINKVFAYLKKNR